MKTTYFEIGSRVRYICCGKHYKDTKSYFKTGIVLSIETKVYPWDKTPKYEYKIIDDKTGKIDNLITQIEQI